VENGWRLGKRVGESQEGVGRNPGEKGWGVKLGGLDAKNVLGSRKSKKQVGVLESLRNVLGV